MTNAPEWTRTTTGKSPHKALNLARLPIPPRAQGGEYSPADVGRRRPSEALAACIRPHPSLLYEHMFDKRSNPPGRGGTQTWI
jgi:hypothetical protein